MKTWKLLAIISNTPFLKEKIKQYQYADDIPIMITMEVLSYSTEIYSVCKGGLLRTKVSNYSFDINLVEELSALDAFKKYGETAVFEAIDKGSYKIPD